MRLVPVARRAVRSASALVDRALPPPPGVVVLAYHQVGAPDAGPVNLPVARFEEQVAHLVEVASPVSLDDACDALAAGRLPDTQGGRRPVVVTFDDGTADFVEHAVPVLARHRVPVTLYLATACIEDGRSFWDDGTVLSWSALADALTTGVVAVGSHTHDHLLLDRVAPADAADDLDRSRGLIADRLGVDARHFAYPKALAPSAAVAPLVAQRFRSAALAGSRPNRPGGTDLQSLARTPVLADDSLAWFARKADGGLRLEGAARATFDRVRHRGARR